MENLKDKTYIGVVVDNYDPKRLGRVRVRVLNVFDDIPVDDIPFASPMKDVNGNSFNIPDVNKVVEVKFDNGNVYAPLYLHAEHYNINLEKKLSSLTKEDYLSNKALLFDQNTQIYVNDTEGLKIDYKYNFINMTKDRIDINLKDNFSQLNLGNSTGNLQQAMLGNHWLDWFDKLSQVLMSGAYLGNLGAPVVATPDFINILNEYTALRKTFISDHVNIVDNQQINKKDRIADGQVGDKWSSTISKNPINVKTIDFKPKAGVASEIDDPNYVAPSTEQGVPSSPQKNDPLPSNASLDNQPEIQKLISVIKSKGYKVFDTPYQPNIVGVRKKDVNPKVTNKFDEVMHFFFKDDSGEWVHRKYTITTVPGLEKNKTHLPNRVAVLAAGQYIDYWKIRLHAGQYEALGTRKDKQAVHRQKETDYYDFSIPVTYDGGGINIHRSGQPNGNNVYNWSEGCQVFKYLSEFQEFLSYCKKYRDLTQNDKFTYTLLNSRDLA